MSSIRIEFVVWVFGLVLFGTAALCPDWFINFLGRGREKPSPGALLIFRSISGFCFFGAIYRLFTLYQMR
jgi:hypothetical protein